MGSVDKALQLVLLLRTEHSVSVKEAAEHLAVAPSTAHRLLGALTHRGFATQDGQRRYRPGPHIGTVMAAPLSVARLREAFAEPMAELQAAVAETVQLMIMRGENIQFIDGIEGRATLRVGVRMGDQMPAYCSSGGKAMLAELTPADIEQIYRDGLPPWPAARIGSVAELKRHLAETRRAGFGINVEETEQGVVGIGMALHSAVGNPVAAVTVALPSARFRKDQLDGFVAALRACREATEVRLSARAAQDDGPTGSASRNI